MVVVSSEGDYRIAQTCTPAMGVFASILSCKYVQVSVCHPVALLAPDLSCEVPQHWYCLCKFLFGKHVFLVNMLLLNLLDMYLSGIIVVYTPLSPLRHKNPHYEIWRNSTPQFS